MVTRSKCVCSMRFSGERRENETSDSLGRWTKTPQKLTVSSRSGLRIIVPTSFALSLTASGENHCEFDRVAATETMKKLLSGSFQRASRRELWSICWYNRVPEPPLTPYPISCPIESSFLSILTHIALLTLLSNASLRET